MIVETSGISRGKVKPVKKLSKIILYYCGIPFCACLPGFLLNLCGMSEINCVLVPLLAAGAYAVMRKKLDMALAAKVNGLTLVILLCCFTGLMVISSGSVEGVLMANFCWLLLPFGPIMLILVLMDRYLLLYVTAFLTYGVSFAVTAYLGKIKIKKSLLVLGAACIAVSTALYLQRAAVKYAGHGFDYMHGYSSTDFADYMVYSPNSRLAVLDDESRLVIEREEDMPVLDGAEACYPLYAAFAKAAYKDIDKIESQWLRETDNPYCNGKIVTFTNSVQGFDRLLYKEVFGNGIDMFFGARPSASQLQEAAEHGIELEITPIAREAFVFFVEANTPIDNLTTRQLKAIYHGDITNWQEVGGSDQKILAFQRPENSGSQTMMQYFMGDVPLKEPMTYEIASAMVGVISRVAQFHNESGAIGYSFRYFLEELNQEQGVKILDVDGVYPSLESIADGSYPLVADVCLITRKNDPNPNVQAMIDFILSEQGQEIVWKTGYVGIG